MFLKKLLLVFIILITLFWIAIFKAPWVSKTLEWWLWINGISDKVRDAKDTLDEASTNVPSINELKQWYTKAYSWAVDAKQKIHSGIIDTKNFIDSTRKTLSGAEQMYNDAKWVYEDTKDVIDGVQGKIDSAKEILEDGQKLQDTLSDNLNKEILE